MASMLVPVEASLAGIVMLVVVSSVPIAKPVGLHSHHRFATY